MAMTQAAKAARSPENMGTLFGSYDVRGDANRDLSRHHHPHDRQARQHDGKREGGVEGVEGDEAEAKRMAEKLGAEAQEDEKLAPDGGPGTTVLVRLEEAGPGVEIRVGVIPDHQVLWSIVVALVEGGFWDGDVETQRPGAVLRVGGRAKVVELQFCTLFQPGSAAPVQSGAGAGGGP